VGIHPRCPKPSVAFHIVVTVSNPAYRARQNWAASNSRASAGCVDAILACTGHLEGGGFGPGPR
jgi:hypothetical protein